ncbi:unnamed protein product [Lota lota]
MNRLGVLPPNLFHSQDDQSHSGLEQEFELFKTRLNVASIAETSFLAAPCPLVLNGTRFIKGPGMCTDEDTKHKPEAKPETGDRDRERRLRPEAKPEAETGTGGRDRDRRPRLEADLEAEPGDRRPSPEAKPSSLERS